MKNCAKGISNMHEKRNVKGMNILLICVKIPYTHVFLSIQVWTWFLYAKEIWDHCLWGKIGGAGIQ